MNCPIWNTPAQQIENMGDSAVWDSPRSGGRYRISGTGLGRILSFTDHAKVLLTSWLCEQRHAGIEAPYIRSDVLELIKARRLAPVPQRLAAALLFLGRNIKKLGEGLHISEEDDANTLRCLAETESSSADELFELYEMLKSTGHVDAEFYQGGALDVKPTAGGWQEIERLSTKQVDSAQAFVAMWFNGITEPAFIEAIVPAVTELGYRAFRVDKKEHNNKIDDEIVAEIRRSRFLIADFTCDPGQVRGGVYYEAGFAQGLGLPVIWTCKDTSMKDLHFDTRQYAHIVWNTPQDLYQQLKNRIGATLGDGPLGKA